MLPKLPDINPNQSLSIDLETYDAALKTLAPAWVLGDSHGWIVGIAIATVDKEYYIPVQHAEGENYSWDEVRPWLTKVLSGNYPKLFFNAQYDLGWLVRYGIHVHGSLIDSMLACPLIDENRNKYNLDSVSEEYLGVKKEEEGLTEAIMSRFSGQQSDRLILTRKFNNALDNYAPAREAVTFELTDRKMWHEDTLKLYDIDVKRTIKHTITKDELKAYLWKLPACEVEEYAKMDVRLTYDLWYNCFKKMIEDQKLTKVFHLECELVPCLIDMRLSGVRIDIDGAIELDRQYTQTIAEYQEQLNRAAGFPVDVNSDGDLVKICERHKLSYEKTDAGNVSFTTSNMPNHEAFDFVKLVRKYTKARDTFIRGYFFTFSINGYIHAQYNQLRTENDGASGLKGTVTGRFSSSQPNLQNIPSRGETGNEVRSLFIPDDGTRWLCLDYSGQEPRMLTHLAIAIQERYGNDKYIVIQGADIAREERFSGRDSDFHAEVSKAVVDKKYKPLLEAEKEPTTNKFSKLPWYKKTEEVLNCFDSIYKYLIKCFRTPAKAIGLGIMYSRGAASVAVGLSTQGIEMSVAEAKELKKTVVDSVPFLESVNQFVMNRAKLNGYITTLLGRRGRFPTWEVMNWDTMKREEFATHKEAEDFFNENNEKKTKTFTNKKTGIEFTRDCDTLARPQRAWIYKALNKYIQGSSADQAKTGILAIYKNNDMTINALDILYRRVDFEPKIPRMQVHDEASFNPKPDEDFDWYQRTMENCIKLKVESKADMKVGNNWKECK